MTTTLVNYDVEMLNTLLRGELAAVESYENALVRFSGELEEIPLRHILHEHINAVAALREHIMQFGCEPSESSGPWGYFTAVVTQTAKMFGPATTLAALRKVEQHGAITYEEALDNELLSEECRMLISEHLLPQTRSHMLALDRLTANEA